MVILRTTWLRKAKYEWGVHVTAFAHAAALTSAEIKSLATPRGDLDCCWNASETALIQRCESLHQQATLGEAVWRSLVDHFKDSAVLQLLMLAGFYRTVSYLVNSLQLPTEPNAGRFPSSIL